MQYKPEIDGLRAIAVLAVVLYHAGIGSAGFVGVDVFFVISGYLITSLLLKEHAESGSIDLLAFYARRVRRIFPAAAVVVLATLGASSLLLSFEQQTEVAQSAGAALVFGANVFFQLTTGGYWDSASEQMPLLHLWSLSVEEQFYFLWPALLIFTRSRRTMLALALVSFGLAEYWIAQGSDAAFFQMPARFWELAVGGLIASLPVNEAFGALGFKRRVHEGVQERAGLVGGERQTHIGDSYLDACDGLRLLSGPRVNARQPLPGVGGGREFDFDAVSGDLSHSQSRAVHGSEIIRKRSAFILRWMSRLGVVLTLGACVVPLGHFPGVGALPAVLGAALVIGAVHGGQGNRFLASRPMVGVGLISYSLYLWHWPLLAFYRATSVDDSMQTKLLLCGVAVLLAIASYRYVEQPFRRMRFPSGRTVAVGASTSLLLALSACAVGLREPPPETARVALDRYRDPCANTVFDLNVPKCPSTSNVAVWGDSHASAWMPAFPGAATLNLAGCPPMLDWLPEDTHPADLKCKAWAHDVADYLPRFDTVVIAANWPIYDDRTGFAKALDVLKGVRRVIVLGPTPTLPKGVPDCMRLGLDCAVPRADFDAKAAPILADLREAAKAYPNVEVIDLTDQFCTPTECPAIKDGIPLYWDQHHISVRKARATEFQ